MNTLNRTFRIMRHTLALSALLGAGLLTAQAQQANTAAPAFNFQVPAVAPEATFSSSSSENNEIAVAENHFDFVGATEGQPPSRRGYGRPRYRGGNTNADGSSKWAFLVGGGFTAPTGDTAREVKTNWGFQVGGGRNFNKNFGLLVQFDWDNFGLQGSTIRKQEIIYDPTGDSFNGYLDGYSHVWSFSLNPVYNIAVNEGLGAYITGGVGFYHKITTFTVPQAGTYCDYYCYQYVADAPIDSYTSNAPGFNGGFGFTYKISRFANERFYAEARYVYIENQIRPGITINNYSGYAPGYNYPTNNLYPANSQHTSYIPVKFGIRF